MAQCFTDRELSWLQFDLRVLCEAGDRSVPLLERLKFLAIYYSNLDEFFMVRMGSLMHREALMPEARDAKTGWDTAAQLKHAAAAVSAQQETAARICKKLLSELKEHDIELVDFRHLSKMDENISKKVFSEIRPLLSPQVVDAEHPLPFLWNLTSYSAALLEKNGSTRLGLVSSDRLPDYRIFETNGRQKVILIPELIAYYAKQLYRHYTVRESCVIRVTRNADVLIDKFTQNENYCSRREMEKLLRKRRREQPVRLQISGRVSDAFREYLEKKIGISDRYTFSSTVPFCLKFWKELQVTPELKYTQQHPQKNVRLEKGQYFRYLAQKDLLLSFPYQSMTPFIDLLYEAADDPDVRSIQITLYRLASSSKIAVALAYAADRGKHVECLLELRARFDEQNNIDYSEMLENAGCKICYGLPRYKVHSKVCLITRMAGDQATYITQVGTGNYNESTSEQYCDLSYITSDQAVGEDAVRFFQALQAGALPTGMNALRAAPYGFRSPLLEALEVEREKGSEGLVRIKVNGMNDLVIMRKLIECSQAGVQVELCIRGICCLLPGIPGFTENIRVSSVVGRYLEHSRIFIFGKGADRRVFIGSGDLLNRNTQRRVEAFIAVKDPDLQAQVVEVMDAFSQDCEKRWEMQPDGSYRKAAGEGSTASQDRLYQYFGSTLVTPPAAPDAPEAPEASEKPAAAHSFLDGLRAWLKRLFRRRG